MENLFVKVDDKEFGPVSLGELKQLIKEGSFSKEDYIWSEDLDEWVPAKHTAELQSLFTNGASENHYQKKLYAIASGKGGVGKTVISSSLGVGLSSMGQEVILVDADFGGANLHTCMGMLEPDYTFFDFYTLQKESLSEIVLDTPVDNLNMISGACGTLGLANPKFFQKQRFVRELKKLQADSIILDLGAGSGYNIIDFFLLADEKILVMTPEPTSVYEVFGFVKVCLMRELNRKLKKFPDALAILAKEEINKPNKIQLTMGDLLKEIEKMNPDAFAVFKETLENFNPKLIVNMVKSRDEIKEGQAIQAAALELLSINITLLGYISYDPAVKDAVKAMKPLLIHDAKSKASQDLAALIRVNLLGKKGMKEILERRRWRKQVESYAEEYPKHDRLANAPICSVRCYYWGDCEYEDGGSPCPVRHLEPVLRDNLAPTLSV